MTIKFWLVGFLALSQTLVALLYGPCPARCQGTVSSAAGDANKCCAPDKPACCSPDDAGNDPSKEMVFKVEGLRCPAVKGIGCGHLLYPVLASLQKIEGVRASWTNYTGTMIRVAVTTASNKDQAALEARKALSKHRPVPLTGNDLEAALEKEEWRESQRVGELSAVEFRTLAVYRIKKFSQAEKLDRETSDKLTRLAIEEWERLSEEARKEKATQPEDWSKRCKKAIPTLLAKAKEVLADDQIDRFKKVLATPCRDEDRPEAPPALSSEPTCTLTPDQLDAQREQLLPGLFKRAERVEDIPDGLRFRFASRPGLVAELAAIIEKERVCCSFLAFRLITEKSGGPITLEVSGPPGTAKMLSKLYSDGCRSPQPRGSK
jgi:hypothetical protein